MSWCSFRSHPFILYSPRLLFNLTSPFFSFTFHHSIPPRIPLWFLQHLPSTICFSFYFSFQPSFSIFSFHSVNISVSSRTLLTLLLHILLLLTIPPFRFSSFYSASSSSANLSTFPPPSSFPFSSSLPNHPTPLPLYNNTSYPHSSPISFTPPPSFMFLPKRTKGKLHLVCPCSRLS